MKITDQGRISAILASLANTSRMDGLTTDLFIHDDDHTVTASHGGSIISCGETTTVLRAVLATERYVAIRRMIGS